MERFTISERLQGDPRESHTLCQEIINISLIHFSTRSSTKYLFENRKDTDGHPACLAINCRLL